jgi:hypothetical protein
MKLLVALVLVAGGCAAGGTQVEFDLDADWSQQSSFYAFPYPSDLRLGPNGGPDLRGFLNGSGNTIVDSLVAVAQDRPGFPVVPVAWFHFTGAMAPLDSETVIPAQVGSPFLLVDVDPASPERGRLRPTVATTPELDDYVPENLIAVAPRPGFVLAPNRQYAFVALRSLGDAQGQKLAVAPSLAALARGGAPSGARGAAAQALYAPLWVTLRAIGVDPAEVAAATVFTTGDVVDQTAQLSTALLGKYQVSIDGLKVNFPNGADQQDRFCEFTGTVTYPQFQTGMPPFGSGGLFQFTDGGLPAKQRDEVAPMVITLPRGTMPAGGYPLMIYFHGSGGVSTQVVDRGPKTADGNQANGQGPSYVVAPFGLATAASALPLNPERLPGAVDTQYLNFNNLAAFRDTFRQGVIEQRLFMEALRTLRIPAATAAACTGVSLPPGETDFHFDPDQLVAMGQSMGGMYTNLIGAVEPRIRAAVPTGAGGFWSLFMLKTTLIAGLPNAVAGILDSGTLTFMHPALGLLQTAWEAADPIVYMPRLGHRPLDGTPRPIYEPVGKDDSYFPTVLYDAIALSYEHQEAGDEVWPTMQDALALDGLAGIMSYPVRMNRPSLEGTGSPYTGVIVQYAGDGFSDPHAIAFQLDAVKYQYGCFLSTFLATGVGTVPAPAPLGTPCPQ